MTTIPKVFYVVRDSRDYFFKDVLPDWVKDDLNYQVYELAVKPGAQDEQATIIPEEVEHQLDLMYSLFELQDEETKQLKALLEDAVELIESIHEFANKPTESLLESKGLLKVVAQSCSAYLKAREEK